MKKRYKYIYGPLWSWRLGNSLGIDLFGTNKKICSFNCIYCQLGKTGTHTRRRRIYVPTKAVLDEIRQLPESILIDYITFSGMGEPTLARNLGAIIRGIRKLRKEPIAVITNASLITDKSVRKDLLHADWIIAKLDAPSEEVFQKVNIPVPSLYFTEVIQGLLKFRKEYKGKLTLQMMYTPVNQHCAEKLATLAKRIQPDCVELNTPLRKCSVKPLSRATLKKIQHYFKDLPTVCVYDKLPSRITPKPLDARALFKRHGKKQ